MDKKPLIGRWSSIGIILLFIGAGISSATALVSLPSEEVSSLKTTTTVPGNDSPKGETELKYYTEENLDQVVGTCAIDTWKTAIRLTQDEMAPYADWTMTSVNVAFSGENGQPEIDIKIYIYDKGTTSTKPGPVIVSDTIYHLDTTGVTNVPLVTPVDLAGHEELWVAIEWNQTVLFSYFARIDTLSGPHVPDKSDFINLGTWQQLHDALPEVDGRWGIGAIVEGLGVTELSIGNIKGPIGITANVYNTGLIESAVNVSWSITVSRGPLGKVIVLKNGTIPSIAVSSSMSIGTGMFIGFNKIHIKITAQAENAPEVIATRTAFILGPFVIGMR